MKLVAHTYIFKILLFDPLSIHHFFDESLFKNISLTKRPHKPFVQNLIALRPTVYPLGINSE